MKRFQLFAILALALGMVSFSSCSGDDDYIYSPALASAQSNSLFVHLVDEWGNDFDLAPMLANNKISAYGEASRQERTPHVYTDYLGYKVLDFGLDLPNNADMHYDEGMTYGTGSAKTTLKVNGVKIPLEVNFEFHAATDKNIYGGSSIYISSIEYNGQKIVPSEYLRAYSVEIHLTQDGVNITPLAISKPEEPKKEDKLNFEDNELAQTTWDCHQTLWDDNNNRSDVERTFILQFGDEPNGWYIEKNENNATVAKYPFSYHVKKNVLTIEGCAIENINAIWTNYQKYDKTFLAEGFVPQRSNLCCDKRK